ncbi:MAG: hypothetical protein HY695_39085 [Deltaproteobacteria bacterium]|nr:hypothetical protein [Deltaproteobacteria bacterium]
MTTIRNGIKVFIAGSRRLSRLNTDVRRRIDNILDKGFTVIVGDANGADTAVQRYLSSRNYNNVVVFCMEGGCRNNIGDWPTRTITATDPGRRDFAYYSTKDRVMAEEADYGLMLWDGRSRGTLTNIVHLVRKGKPVVVYIAPDRSFYTLRRSDDLTEILTRLDPAALRRIDRDLQAAAMDGSSNRKVDTAPLF